MMGMRLVEGTTITDTTKAAAQALVNAGFAKKYWPGRSALGHRIRVVYKGQGDWQTIVGVAADALDGRPHRRREPAHDLHGRRWISFSRRCWFAPAPGADPMPAVRVARRAGGRRAAAA